MAAHRQWTAARVGGASLPSSASTRRPGFFRAEADLDRVARLKTFDCKHEPVIRTIHALCVEVIGEKLRMLLPHEVDAMIYDVLHEYPEVAALYDGFGESGQALRDHDAGHAQHLLLWMAVQQWLVRHKAHLVGRPSAPPAWNA